MHGHGAHDDMRYVPKELFEAWSRRDPIERYEETLRADGHDTEALRESVREELQQATEWALEQPMPDPGEANEGVFADSDPELGDGEAPWSRWAREEVGSRV
jgi:pyruvate dehydrogenase E1 component alpha subunit